jgi:hypothetical protein
MKPDRGPPGVAIRRLLKSDALRPMDAFGPWLDFLLAAFATWRLSVLLVNEDGPYRFAARLRAALSGSEFGRTLDCVACTSLLIALPVAFLALPRRSAFVISWFALSGAALVIERITADRLVIERADETSEGD